MNKTVFLHNGSEFDSKYPNGIVPQDELAAVGQYENIFSFVKNVFGVDPASLNPSINITSNSQVDVSTYAYAYVNVALPEGYVYTSGTKSITNNGSSIDVNTYKYVNVDVPASGITPTGTYNITDNGTFNVYTYANASVNVPASAVVSGTKSITSNGTSDVTNYASVNVNVPIPAGYIVPSGTKSITTNGTGIDVTAYASVDVAVPASGITPTGTYNITDNGTYDVTSYASAYVSVSGGGGPVLNWQSVTAEAGNYGVVIYPTLGSTYVFKTSASDVYLGILTTDTDGSGDINTDDEPYGGYGTMEPNKEYYLTIQEWEHEGMTMTAAIGFYGLAAWGPGTSLPEGTVIQYANIDETPQYTTAVIPSDHTALPININPGQTIEIHSMSTTMALVIVNSNDESVYSGVWTAPFYLTNSAGNISGIKDAWYDGGTIEYRIF